jgi:hypothetical protein
MLIIPTIPALVNNRVEKNMLNILLVALCLQPDSDDLKGQ